MATGMSNTSITPCPDCNGQVDVPTGMNLRCGCGRKVVPRPMLQPVELLRLFVGEMAAHGITRLQTPEGFVIDMPTRPRAPEAPPAEVKDPRECKCGHHFEIDHTEAGCVHGCPVEVCESGL